MTWKKALFFGGAVVLLAACDRATAPNAMMRVEGAQAAAKSPNTAPKTPTTPTMSTVAGADCIYVVHTGLVCVPEEF